MKKTLTLIAALLLTAATGMAQYINVHKTDGTTVKYSASEVDYIGFTAASTDNPGGDNGHAPAGVKAVDLGLPSGTLWANMNVGATSPQEDGLYFAWGETVGYTSNTGDGRSFDWASYKWMNEGQSSWWQINKYQVADGKTDACWYAFNWDMVEYEFIGDGKTVLDLEDDAARANWGGDWRMPTYEDFQELTANTTSEWITVGTVKGRRFTSKTNGNSIFLPAAGFRNGSSLSDRSSNGNYWSSTVNPMYSNGACYLYFNSSSAFTDAGIYSRINGYSVRPVR